MQTSTGIKCMNHSQYPNVIIPDFERDLLETLQQRYG